MPRRSTQEYSFIKTYAEVHFGVMTQCVLQKNVERANPQLINNLLQKVNTKMGGVNTKVSGNYAARFVTALLTELCCGPFHNIKDCKTLFSTKPIPRNLHKASHDCWIVYQSCQPWKRYAFHCFCCVLLRLCSS